MLQVEIQGAAELANGLNTVGGDLEKTAPEAAFQLILSAAQARAPVRTGALRASGFFQQTSIGFSVHYASPVHWGARGRPARPFLTDAINETENQWMQVYSDDVQRQLDTIKGA